MYWRTHTRQLVWRSEDTLDIFFAPCFWTDWIWSSLIRLDCQCTKYTMVLDSELRLLCLCSRHFTDWSSPPNPFQLCFLSVLFPPHFHSLFFFFPPLSFSFSEMKYCYVTRALGYTPELRGSSYVSLPNLCMSVPPKFWIVLWKTIAFSLLIWFETFPYLSLVFFVIRSHYVASAGLDLDV